jgi:hypothetical protein
MTDRNDLVSAQEKLEWVTPTISLMEAENTLGRAACGIFDNKEDTILNLGPS